MPQDVPQSLNTSSEPAESAVELRPIRSLEKSMVLASLRAPRSGDYVMQEVCELDESVDLGLLRRAWRIVSHRHTALRTSIEIREGRPACLRLHEAPEIGWRELDWTGMSPEAQQAEWPAFLRQDRESGFDFEAGVPIRFAVLRTSQRSGTLVWTSHHALLDGRSYSIVWREWLGIYDSLVRGEEVQWVEPAAAGDWMDHAEPGAEQYWRHCFDGVSQTTDYIVDRIRPATIPPPEAIARESVCVSGEVTQQLREFAVRHEVTVNTLVQGAWALLLSRYSGRPDVVFGVTRSGRGSPRDDARAGLFIHILPLRIAVEPESKLEPWLKRIRSQWVEMREFEHTPLDQIWKWSGLPPGMPPFESLVNYEHEPEQETLRKLGGRWSNRTFRRFQRTDSPLTLAAYGSPVLTLDIVFDTRFFCQSTMAAAAGHLKTLLESFLAQSDARLSDLRMLTADEHKFLVEENNRARRCRLPDVCAHELFEQQAQRTPHAVALEGADGSVSYEEVNRRANRLARYLREAGTAPEDLIAICMKPSPESVIAVLAILKSGAAFLPLEPALPRDRLLGMLAEARPKCVLYECPSLAGQLDENLPNIATPANAAYAIYTSGSSGKPKAVVVSHRALVNHTLAASSVFDICETDRRLQFASIGTDVFVAEVFNYLCRGAALVFGWNRRNASMREFLGYLDERRITITGLPSAWWSEWVAAMEQAGMAAPQHLRAVIMGMEKADPAAFLSWKRVISTEIRLFNAYGPAETSPTATVYEAGSSAWEAESFVPIGKPLANTRVYVLDGHGKPVPAGVAGELWIGGPGVARGYLNAPEPTAQSFVPDPFSAGSGGQMYRTGDMVFYLPDGNLVFVGRRDRQVKIRGFRVELDEIETALARHPGIGPCAVMAVGKEGKANLVAYITAGGAGMPSREALRLFLSKHLPEHMLPAAFVPLPEMPMTAGGKIDRQALPPCDLERVRAETDFQPPSTPAEQRLAAIWTEVLGVTPIGATDNFFDRGADSLDATRLITLIETHFGKESPLASFWRAPTLARMARLLEEPGASQAENECDAIVPLQMDGSRVPFFCFPGADENPYYFLDLALSLGQDRPFYIVRDPRPVDGRGSYTVEEAADRFIAVIRSVQQEGPYIVGGHCYGGIVAFEVARQLVARGEEVGIVVLFEAPAPGYPKVLRHWRNYGRQAMSILRGEHHVTLRDARSHLEVLMTLFRRKAAGLKRRLLMRAGLKRVVEPVERREYPAIHPNTQSGRSYAPKAFSCNVVQFIAAGERHSTLILDDPRLGWRELTQGEFTVRETPGKAAEIFKPPHVRELAAQLRVVLDGLSAG
jgi:amino acid adenylation domain-containing protein